MSVRALSGRGHWLFCNQSLYLYTDVMLEGGVEDGEVRSFAMRVKRAVVKAETLD